MLCMVVLDETVLCGFSLSLRIAEVDVSTTQAHPFRKRIRAPINSALNTTFVCLGVRLNLSTTHFVQPLLGLGHHYKFMLDIPRRLYFW